MLKPARHDYCAGSKKSMAMRGLISLCIVLFFSVAYLVAMFQPDAYWLLAAAGAGVIFFVIRIIRGDN